MKSITMNTNLVPFFTGTYENIWEITETDDHGNEYYTVYDFDEFMKGIASAYESKADDIRDMLAIPFILGLKFPGTYYSPREYNFSTDSIDFIMDIDEGLLLSQLNVLKDNAEFEQFLQDNFSDRSGFWSWTPNNYAELYKQITTEGDQYEQAMGALIQFLAKDVLNSNRGFYDSIEWQIYEYWQGNGYGGIDYHAECDSCYKPIEYDNDFKCQNKDCKQYQAITA